MEEKLVYNPKLKRRMQIIDVILALIIVGFMIFSLINYNNLKQQMTQEVEISGLVGVFILTFFLEFIPQIMNPILGVLAALTAQINVHFVVLTAVIASFMGSVLGFWIGKKYGSKYVYALFERKTILKIHNFWEKYGKWFVLVSAVTPVPYVPMIFGALHMKWKDFALYGLLPRILNFAVPGYAFYYGISLL